MDQRFVANPFSAYEQLRAARETVIWVPEHKAYWVLSRSGALQVLSEHSRFLQKQPAVSMRGLLSMEQPRHSPVRSTMEGIFQVLVNQLGSVLAVELDKALTRTDRLAQFDFMAEIGRAVPRRTYWQLYAPDSEALCNAYAEATMRHTRQPVRPGIDDEITAAGSRERLVEVVKQLLKDAIGAGAGSPFHGTMVGLVAQAVQPGGPLTREEAVVTLVEVALVHMSSQFLLGSATRNLLYVPAGGRSAWSQLAAITDPTDFGAELDSALAEARRIDPPVTLIDRHVEAEQQVGGFLIPANSRVCANVGSANRDAVAGGDPETFIWTRDPGTEENLSLGHGIHECVGKYMQEEIVKGVLTKVIPHYPGLRMYDQDATPAWIDNIYFRSLNTLPVIR